MFALLLSGTALLAARRAIENRRIAKEVKRVRADRLREIRSIQGEDYEPHKFELARYSEFARIVTPDTTLQKYLGSNRIENLSRFEASILSGYLRERRSILAIGSTLVAMIASVGFGISGPFYMTRAVAAFRAGEQPDPLDIMWPAFWMLVLVVASTMTLRAEQLRDGESRLTAHAADAATGSAESRTPGPEAETGRNR
ncbi:hypothetical protein GCM10027298_08230 [Epidermidibacterium keratini]